MSCLIFDPRLYTESISREETKATIIVSLLDRLSALEESLVCILYGYCEEGIHSHFTSMLNNACVFNNSGLSVRRMCV